MAKSVFNPEEYSDRARITDGDRSEMEAALVQHVYGQRVTKIECTRKIDKVASKKQGQIVEYVEVAVYLENNIMYVNRVNCHLGGIILRGDGLATVDSTDPNYCSK